MELLLFAIGMVPICYLVRRFSRSVIAYERSQYDDSDCPPGFTKYPGPM